MSMPFPIRIPGQPVPQGSHAVSRTSHIYESNSRLKQWRSDACTVMTLWMGAWYGAWQPYDGPLAVDVTFTVRRPQRPKFDEPAVKPDLDKLQRALGDAMTIAGLITDDARITAWHARKRYGDPGVTIHSIRTDRSES